MALDHYYRREEDRPLLTDIVLAANEAQRGFLELCDDEVFGMVRLVHNCCRLAGLVSSRRANLLRQLILIWTNHRSTMI